MSYKIISLKILLYYRFFEDIMGGTSRVHFNASFARD